MNRRSIIVVLSVAVVLAALFAVGGAGLFGSPFGPGKLTREYVIAAAAILIGPAAGSAALFFQRRRSRLAGTLLIIGAVLGTAFGLVLESDFRYFWGRVFAVVVWLPMLVIGIKLFLYRLMPDSLPPPEKGPLSFDRIVAGTVMILWGVGWSAHFTHMMLTQTVTESLGVRTVYTVADNVRDIGPVVLAGLSFAIAGFGVLRRWRGAYFKVLVIAAGAISVLWRVLASQL